jgi:hypothetical protein
VMLMVRVTLEMFRPALFYARFALAFLAVSVLTKVFCIRWDWDYSDCCHSCDVRGARVGCLVITFISVSGIDLRAFRRRDREGVREGSISADSEKRQRRRQARGQIAER